MLASWFSFIGAPMESALVNLALFVGSAGIAVLLLTIIIRLILSPLQIVQLRSARAMQRLQPHIAELRNKHGKDKQKLTEETMKLYREHKANPALGSLSVIIQLPILIALFWALSHLGTKPTTAVLDSQVAFHSWLVHSYHYSETVYNLFHTKVLWLSSGLSKPDPLYILPVLAGVTQWIQSRMMVQESSDPRQQAMNMIVNFTPLIIVFFAARCPSGLSLYWIASTMIAIMLSVKIMGWGSVRHLPGWHLGRPPQSPPPDLPRPGPPFSPPPAPSVWPSGAKPPEYGAPAEAGSPADSEVDRPGRGPRPRSRLAVDVDSTRV